MAPPTERYERTRFVIGFPMSSPLSTHFPPRIASSTSYVRFDLKVVVNDC